MICNSIIINLIFAIFNTLKNAFNSSPIFKVMGKFEEWLSNVLNGSTAWNLFRRRDSLTEVWENSLIYRSINWMFNIVPTSLSSIYSKKEQILQESRFIQYLRFTVERFDVVIALCLVIILVVPHNYWDNMYSTLIVLLLFALYAFKIIINKNDIFNFKALDIALVIFIITVVMAQVTSLFPKESLRFFIFFATSFLLLINIVSSIRSERSLNTFIEIILVGITITGLYAIYQTIKGVPFDPSLTDLTLNEGMAGRAYSSMGNPNNYAELLILTLPFYAAVIFNSKSMLKRLVFIVLLLPPLLGLFTTGSRSSWIALVISIIVLVFFKEWRLIPLVIILGVLAFPLLPYISPTVYKRVLTIFNSNDTSIGYRGLIYQTIEPMFKDFWLTGVGLGAGVESAPFMKILQRYSLYYLQKSVPGGYVTTPPHTHNLFLQIWIEVGFMGILTFIWFIFRLFKKCMLSIFNKVNDSIRHIFMAGLAALSGILVMGVPEHVWFYPRIMLFFWVIVGIMLAALNVSATKQEVLEG